jgi:hypothetical protein
LRFRSMSRVELGDIGLAYFSPSQSGQFTVDRGLEVVPWRRGDPSWAGLVPAAAPTPRAVKVGALLEEQIAPFLIKVSPELQTLTITDLRVLL